MKRALVILFTCGLFSFRLPPAYLPGTGSTAADTLPVALPADFTDDYGIRYSISDSVWVQHPSSRYHILRWNLEDQYIIARNDTGNPAEKGLYTRIDYMRFTNMQPYLWGFCLTTYNAQTDSLAEFGPSPADRLHPRTGCNGYPFSRMKKTE